MITAEDHRATRRAHRDRTSSHQRADQERLSGAGARARRDEIRKKLAGRREAARKKRDQSEFLRS